MNKNIDIKNIKTAKRYALALAQSAADNIDEIDSDLNLISESIFDCEDLKTFFLHPIVGLKDKKETIEETFKGKINDKTLSFVQTLLDEGRFGIFRTICELFKDEKDRIKNMQRVQIVSAVELDEKEKEKLEKKLSQKLNKEIIPNYDCDSDIIAGIVVKLDDKIIDLSLRAKFNELKKIN